jgi:hypothetical protein
VAWSGRGVEAGGRLPGNVVKGGCVGEHGLAI